MLSSESKAIASRVDRSPLTLTDKQIIADVLTWDAQREVSADEIETIAIQHDILWVKLTDHRAIPLHVETFRAIRRQQEKAKASPAFVTTQNVVKREPISQSAPAYSANPIGYRGAAANWKAFLASGKKLDLTGDSMQKWRELEQQQKAAKAFKVDDINSAARVGGGIIPPPNSHPKCRFDLVRHHSQANLEAA